MESFYLVLFVVQAALAGYLEYANRSKGNSKHQDAPRDFKSFRNNYLVVYSMMMGTWIKAGCGAVLYPQKDSNDTTVILHTSNNKNNNSKKISSLVDVL